MKIFISADIGGENNNVSVYLKELFAEIQDKNIELIFEKGEYHFFKEGATEKYLSASYNKAENKKLAFFFENMESLTIDGNGSLFVFHDGVFPFAIRDSKNVTIKNITTDCQPFCMALLKACDIDDTGFSFEIDEKKYPHWVEGGALVFSTPLGISSGLEHMFGLHAVDRFKVQYLYGTNCKNPPFNPAAACVIADVVKTEKGVRFTYSEKSEWKCFYQEGEFVVVPTKGMERNVCLMQLNASEDILLENITIRHNIGMGIIAQRCKNLTVDGLRTDEKYADEYVTLTADAMHFVHCYGNMEVKNCDISYLLDDPINVHGVYTIFQSYEGNKVFARIGHQGYKSCDLYRKGDKLSLIDNESLEYVGSLVVEDVEYTDEEGWEFTLEYTDGVGLEKAKKGFLLENPQLMPNLHLHHNHFWHYPNVRFSGGGNMLIEDNHFENGESAFLVFDLAHYWYESGRVNNLVCRNNRFVNCNGMGGDSFITVCVFGRPDTNAPKVHERIELSNNQFVGLKRRVISASGLKNLVLKDNVYETEEKQLFRIDGVEKTQEEL